MLFSLLFFVCLQALTNGGAGTIAAPYTLSIYNPSYALITGQAWNWGASGAANAGIISGPVTQVGAATCCARLHHIVLMCYCCSLLHACLKLDYFTYQD